MSQWFPSLVTCLAILPAIFVGHIQLSSYFLVPVGLVWVHVLGEHMQDNNIGPEWVQNHLHNAGSPGRLLGYVGLVLLFTSPTLASRNYARFRVVDLTMKAVVVLWGLGTLGCVVFEIKEVLFFKERLIADGYSGELDLGDMLAYGIGLSLVLLNYFFMRPIILRKVRQKLDLQ